MILNGEVAVHFAIVRAFLSAFLIFERAFTFTKHSVDGTLLTLLPLRRRFIICF
jgi:hypothetical protein